MERLKRLKKLIEEKGYQGFLATNVENVFYLTNFWGEGMAFFNGDSVTLFTYHLEKERALASAKDCEIITLERGLKIFEVISNRISKVKICIDNTKGKIIQSLKEKGVNVSLEPNLIYEVRRFKEDQEIDKIKKAGEFLDKLYDYSLKILKEGKSEREILGELTKAVISEGYDISNPSTSLQPLIVAFGENSSHPHAYSTDRKLKRGDVILLDLFIRYEGYICDSTRTFILGRAGEKIKEIYELVKSSQEKGLEILREGIEASQVDGVSREILKDFSKYFIHGLGHGVGLEVHEPPTLNSQSKDIIRNRDVVTIEPGVYLPKEFGIRIEDTVSLKEGEKVIFNKFTKDLLEI